MAKLALANFYSAILVVADAEKKLKDGLAAPTYGLVQDYQPSLKEVLGHEGGYTNDPQDPGGPTNWGITLADAKMYWRVDATAADVKAMPLATAKDIYKNKYWAPVCGDELPPGIDYCVFDYGVNSGIHRAIPLLQKLVGVTADGKLGSETMAAVNKACSTQEGRDAVINGYQNARLAFLQGLKTWPHFGGGWGTRVREVRVSALKMSAAVTTMPYVHPTPGPATPQQPPKVNRPVQPPSVSPGMDRGQTPPPAPTGLFAILAAIFKAIFGKK